jgi:DNA-binding HxlR family transcriptional regulator
MQDKSNHVPGEHDRAERLLALLILSHPERRSRTELEAELQDIDRDAIGNALRRLEAEGVVIVHREAVQASRCARHLDTLGLIAV